MLRARLGGAPAPCLLLGGYLHEEGGGRDLVLLVATLQERNEQVEDAAELLAGVVHHGPGVGQVDPSALWPQGDLLGGGLTLTLKNSGQGVPVVVQQK